MMIEIIKNDPDHAIFKKYDPNIPWFNNKCSNEKLLKELGRENDQILKVRWEDSRYIADILNVYFIVD